MTAPPGERHGRAKLTDAAVVDMRRRYASGDGTHLSLAIEYDLSTSTVGKMLRRETWRHV